jgi:hypothetical protein
MPVYYLWCLPCLAYVLAIVQRTAAYAIPPWTGSITFVPSHVHATMRKRKKLGFEPRISVHSSSNMLTQCTNGDNNTKGDLVQSKTVEQKLRQAMVLSQAGQASLMAARQATELWSSILLGSSPSKDDETSLPLLLLDNPSMHAICEILHGHMLSRCGDDKQALVAYGNALTILREKNSKQSSSVDIDTTRNKGKPGVETLTNLCNVCDAMMGQGKCYQRRLEYAEAYNAFRSVVAECSAWISNNSEEGANQQSEQSSSQQAIVSKLEQFQDDAVCRAVTCSCRLGKNTSAISLLVSVLCGSLNNIQAQDDVSHSTSKFLLLADEEYSNSLEKNGKCRAALERIYDHVSDVMIANSKVTTVKAPLQLEQLGLLGVVILMNDDGEENDTKQSELFRQYALHFLNVASTLKVTKAKDPPSRLLFEWIYRHVSGTRAFPASSLWNVILDEESALTPEQHLQLASLNQCACDGPSSWLLQLDDKIGLHSLLTSADIDAQDCSRSFGVEVDRFWPKSFILPQDWTQFVNDERTNHNQTETVWIAKERAGYGSHGNTILANFRSIEKAKDVADGQTESILLQKLVHPPMLLNWRKFSLRLYVLLLPTESKDIQAQDQEKGILPGYSVYLASEGLVKCASSPYIGFDEDGSTRFSSESQMTNSAIGQSDSILDDEGQQYDLSRLKREFEEKGWDYDGLWCSLKAVIVSTLSELSNNYIGEESRGGRTSMLHRYGSIPKILGFDLILDEEGCPWLMEVNRFPGLEERDSSDMAVKRKVVQDAWKVAATFQSCRKGELASCAKESRTSYELLSHPSVVSGH